MPSTKFVFIDWWKNLKVRLYMFFFRPKLNKDEVANAKRALTMFRANNKSTRQKELEKPPTVVNLGKFNFDDEGNPIDE